MVFSILLKLIVDVQLNLVINDQALMVCQQADPGKQEK